MYARVVTTLDTRSAADMNSKGAVGRQPVPHREFDLSGPICAAGLATDIISIT